MFDHCKCLDLFLEYLMNFLMVKDSATFSEMTQIILREEVNTD